MEKLKAAFIFIAPGADPVKHKAIVDTPSVELHVVGVNNYEEAARIAVKLVENGVKAIELCGGFGHKGTSIIADAVKGKARVGVVRFDVHPGLEGKSGDDVFG